MNDFLVLSIATGVGFIGCAMSVGAAIIARRKAEEDIVEFDELKATAVKRLVAKGSSVFVSGQSGSGELMEAWLRTLHEANKSLQEDEIFAKERKPRLAGREGLLTCS